ncbi:DNA sulfur modification protein DndB [Streptomyces sp. NPDC020196]|uniref:DNA sulfur modification protein DndB n=1 Tax=Streptomyces sp. NPDC020196 TaxID=3156656 RepID=UPI0033F58584
MTASQNETTLDAATDALRGGSITIPAKFEAIGFMSHAGSMGKITFTVPFKEVAERLTFERLLTRHDFDTESLTTPGQRDISDKHAEKIATFLTESDRPYLGTLTIAIPEDQVQIEVLQQIANNVSLVKFVVPVTSENPIVEDGQHRVKGLTDAWRKVMHDPSSEEFSEARAMLEKSSIEMTLLLEGDPAVLSTIFVKMASTRPISASLIAIMDSSAVQNRLGQQVTRKSRYLSDRTTYLGAKAAQKLAAAKGRKYDPLYPAAAVRSAAAAIAGVGVRDRTPDQREDILNQIFTDRAKQEGRPLEQIIEVVSTEIVSILDYAFTRVPGWKQMAADHLTASEFKTEYIHSAAAGLHVIANVIAAAQVAGLDARHVVDELAKLPWRRDDLREATKDGDKIFVHQLFEDTLVRTSFDTKTGTWKAGQAGATRGAYEEATRKVIAALSRQSPELAAMQELKVLSALGLVTAGRGRPRKK